MSHDLFQIVKTLNKEDIQTQLALQCAPLLTGIKISNLLIVPNYNATYISSLFQGTSISTCIIYQSDRKTTFLLFNLGELEMYLNQNKQCEVMKALGYMMTDLKGMIKEFSNRYQLYMQNGGMFPHEMGLFLGYPVEDVVGFIENEGKNFLYTGYWKVYNNQSKAVELFERYNEAKEMVIRMVSMGIGIRNILENYSSNQTNKIEA